MVNPVSEPTATLNRTLGAIPLTDDRTRFCVWSPTSKIVHVMIEDHPGGDCKRSVALKKSENGFHTGEVEGVRAGHRYWYRFDEGQPLPDPASRYQPRGVHGPSMVVDSQAYPWSDHQWRGVTRENMIVYELHVGAFSQPGTFSAAQKRLDELVDLGITAIELMPVADAAGRWNWGYDGVCLFAPNRNFGTPDDLRQLVDAAHGKGLAVFLDVVYNHLGPEGNYLGQSGPYLSAHHSTVWGSPPNFDDPVHGPQLRRFFIANAIHWFDEYHIDALRIDAIHCMRDDSEPHVVAELSQVVRDWQQLTGRSASLIAESNVYDPQMIAPLAEGGIGFDAEWCDDFLHSVFAVVRPGERLSHRSYRPGTDLDQTLKIGYVYEGSLREERGRQSPEGERVDPAPLVYSIQHHDCIGNHPLGKRLHQLTSPETQRAAAALLLLCPAIPMLFMGEEFACERPFQFFVDFTDEHLREAVAEGRKREYPQHDWSVGTLPIDEAAFYDSKIGRAEDGDRSMRDWYKSLIGLRKAWKETGLLRNDHYRVENDAQEGLFVMTYDAAGTTATIAVRLAAEDTENSPLPLECPGDLILDSLNASAGVDALLPNHARIYISHYGTA